MIWLVAVLGLLLGSGGCCTVASVLFAGANNDFVLQQIDVGFVDEDGGALLHEVDHDGEAVLGVDFGYGAAETGHGAGFDDGGAAEQGFGFGLDVAAVFQNQADAF